MRSSSTALAKTDKDKDKAYLKMLWNIQNQNRLNGTSTRDQGVNFKVCK